MNVVIVSSILLLLLIFAGIIENRQHNKNLASISFRIHVNGTRGKSSVTRLIASGLREAGYNVCAKTTGTLPRFIIPDGSEYPVYRPTRPNIIEQLRIVKAAAELNADILVIECMALQPILQWMSENKLVRATHGVITNAREDHLDVMGPEEKDVPLALAGMIPPNGKLFTAEKRHLDIFKFAASDRGCELIAVTKKETEAVDQKDMDRFSYVEHKENVALALRVCADIGVDKKTALRGMIKAKPDPGAMTVHEIQFFGKNLIFVNAFAANDPESSKQLWEMILKQYSNVKKRIAVINCRSDRPERSRQLGGAVVNWSPADHYILMGKGTYIFAREARKAGLNMFKISFAEGFDVPDIFEMILEDAEEKAVVVGLGNIGGQGLDLVQYFQNRSHVRSRI